MSILTNPKALIPLVAAGLLFGLFLRRSYQVGIGPAGGEIAGAVGSFGQSLGSVGAGVQELGTGIGTGISKLFNPLFTLRDLIFPPEAGNQPAPTAATQGQLPPETPPATTPVPPPMQPTPPPPPIISAPKQLSVQAARQLVASGQIRTRFAGKLIAGQMAGTGAIRGEQLQLYQRGKSGLIRVRPSTAAVLRKRGLL